MTHYLLLAMIAPAAKAPAATSAVVTVAAVAATAVADDETTVAVAVTAVAAIGAATKTNGIAAKPAPTTPIIFKYNKYLSLAFISLSMSQRQNLSFEEIRFHCFV